MRWHGEDNAQYGKLACVLRVSIPPFPPEFRKFVLYNPTFSCVLFHVSIFLGHSQYEVPYGNVLTEKIPHQNMNEIFNVSAVG